MKLMPSCIVQDGALLGNLVETYVSCPNEEI